jgi:hypothetical protein
MYAGDGGEIARRFGENKATTVFSHLLLEYPFFNVLNFEIKIMK